MINFLAKVLRNQIAAKPKDSFGDAADLPVVLDLLLLILLILARAIPQHKTMLVKPQGSLGDAADHLVVDLSLLMQVRVTPQHKTILVKPQGS